MDCLDGSNILTKAPKSQGFSLAAVGERPQKRRSVRSQVSEEFDVPAAGFDGGGGRAPSRPGETSLGAEGQVQAASRQEMGTSLTTTNN